MCKQIRYILTDERRERNNKMVKKINVSVFVVESKNSVVKMNILISMTVWINLKIKLGERQKNTSSHIHHLI